MDSPEKLKKAHFSISSFKKTKALSSIIHDESENKNEFQRKKKRSSSYIIPKRFVPKLRPHKASINPSYLKLNENTKKFKKENNDNNLETKSMKEILNEEDLSISSFSESNTNLEEEQKIQEEKDFEELVSNDINKKLDFKENVNNININEEKNKDNQLSLFSIRKKLSQIRNNSSLISTIKECIDSSFINLKKKFSFDDIYNKGLNEKKIEEEFSNFYNYKYNSTLIFTDDNGESKGHKPFLIFDVLSKASKHNNL